MKRRKVLVVKFKEETGCLNPDCHWDGAYDAELLDFHHLDQNTKTSSVSKIRHYGKKFKEEIAKCTLLCANCHRLLHSGKLALSSLPLCPEFNLPPQEYGTIGFKKNAHSKYRGVTKHKTGKWQALVKGKYLGLFATEADAAEKCVSYCQTIKKALH